MANCLSISSSVKPLPVTIQNPTSVKAWLETLAQATDRQRAGAYRMVSTSSSFPRSVSNLLKSIVVSSA